jgi:hypothetical protein
MKNLLSMTSHYHQLPDFFPNIFQNHPVYIHLTSSKSKTFSLLITNAIVLEILFTRLKHCIAIRNWYRTQQ